MVAPIEEYYNLMKKKLESLGVKGIFLDIDDTISATNLFWAQSHIDNFGNPEKLTAEEIVRKYRYVSNVPYWNNNKVAEDWIEQHHLSNKGKLELPLVRGAVESINMIKERLVAYLTGRPKSTISGTKKWLERCGFPRLDIIAQPSEATLEQMCLSNGNEWKARVLEYFFPIVEGVIDDNIGLVSHLSSEYRGTIYLFSHEEIDAPTKVICCPTWKEVVNAVRSHKEV